LFSLLSTTFLYKTKNTSIISFLAIYHPKCIPTLLDKMSQDAFKTHLAKFSPRCDSLTPLDHLEKKHRPTISPEEIAKTRNYLLQIIGITPSLEQLSKQLESDAPDLTLVNQLLERCEYYAEYCKGKSQQHEVKLLQQETITEFVSDPTIKTILGVTPHQKKHTTFANQLLNILRKLALSYPDKVDAFVEKILVKLTEEQLFSLLDAKHPYEGSSHLIEKGKEFPIMNFLAIHHPRCIPTLLEHIKLNILGKKNLVTYSPFGLLKPWDYLLLTHGAAFPEAQLSLLLSSHPHELSCSAASVDSLEPQKLLGLTQGATDIDIKPIIIAGDKFLRSQDKENWSMLSIAAWHDPALFRDLLLQRMETTDHEGNAIIKQDQHGFTVLHYVAANGDAALMEELLKKFGRRAKIATDIASKDGWIVVNESSTASDGVSRVASGIRLKLLPPPQPETTSSEKRRSSASAFFEVASSPEKQAQGPRDLDTSASGDPVNRFVR
jgi:hypothetical protein